MYIYLRVHHFFHIGFLHTHAHAHEQVFYTNDTPEREKTHNQLHTPRLDDKQENKLGSKLTFTSR